MAWVTMLGEDEATGELRGRYEADLNQLGFVMEATRALSANPALAMAVDAFEGAVKRTSHLTTRERRLIHLLVADRLRSTYCVLVFAIALERDLGGKDGIREVLREAGLDDAAIVDVATTACLRLFGSRLYDALGVETDPFFLEQKDLVDAITGLVAVVTPGGTHA